jgi:hypothetical protein
MSKMELMQNIASGGQARQIDGERLKERFAKLLGALENSRTPSPDAAPQRSSLVSAGLNALTNAMQSKANDSSRLISNPTRMEDVDPSYLACAGGLPPPGTAVVGVFTMDVPDGQVARERFVEAAAANGGALDTMIVRFMRDKNYPNFGEFAQYLAEDVLAPGGTIAMPDDGSIEPEEFQKAAELTGATIVIPGRGNERIRGITIYEAGKEPVYDPSGGVSDGGFGTRGGCGSEAGVYRN